MDQQRGIVEPRGAHLFIITLPRPNMLKSADIQANRREVGVWKLERPDLVVSRSQRPLHYQCHAARKVEKLRVREVVSPLRAHVVLFTPSKAASQSRSENDNLAKHKN